MYSNIKQSIDYTSREKKEPFEGIQNLSTTFFINHAMLNANMVQKIIKLLYHRNREKKTFFASRRLVVTTPYTTTFHHRLSPRHQNTLYIGYIRSCVVRLTLKLKKNL
jgi:phage FluMu gp28-like protein